MTRRLSTRRAFLISAATAAGVGCYTWQWEPHWLEVVPRPMPIRNLPKDLSGCVVAHLSDLHIGLQVDDRYLQSVFDRVRDQRPEFVVYTGDFTSHHPSIVEHLRRIGDQFVLGQRATFGILGNHDYGEGWRQVELADELTRVLKSIGVTILRNQSATIDGLSFVGLDDLWANRFDLQSALAQIDSNHAGIALTHNPDTVDRSGWEPFDGWILAGHTHGGQCKPPFLPPPMLPVRNRRYTSGEFRLAPSRRLYISRGVGHLLKVRFNARPEVTLFELQRDRG